MPFSHSFLVISSKKRRHPFQFDTFVRLIRGGLKELHDSNEIPQTALRELDGGTSTGCNRHTGPKRDGIHCALVCLDGSHMCL